MIKLTDEWKEKFRVTWDFWEESSRTGIKKEEWTRYSEIEKMRGECAFCDFFDQYQPVEHGLCPLRRGDTACLGRFKNCCDGIYLEYVVVETNSERQPCSKQIFEMIDKWCRENGVFE